jgi:glucokinase
MYLGIDVGGTNLKIGLFDNNITLLDKRQEFTPSDFEPSYLIRRLVLLINEQIIKHEDIQAIGIGFPGVITKKGEVLISPNLPQWKDVPLLEELRHYVKYPIYLENDAKTAAIAEMTVGNGKDFNNFIYITLGTGIGGAVIINREIYRGETSNAGEIGHVIINAFEKNPDRLAFRTGVLEYYAGREAIIERAKKKLLNTNQFEFDVAEISTLANMGDDVAKEIIRETGYLIGIGLVSAVNLFDIPNIIIGGGISKSDILINEITATVKKRALPHISAKLIVKKAFFSGNTGLYGAALLARYNYEKNKNQNTLS